MQTEDLLVLGRALEWAAAGHGITLASVLKTWGSAPRGVGAWMCIRDDGQVVGSVSGGCIEADLIEQVKTRQLSPSRISVKHYGVSREEAVRFGLPCGGQLDLLLERHPDLDSLYTLLAALQARSSILREVSVVDGAVRLITAHAQQHSEFDGQYLRTLHGPAFRLLLIGAGPLSLMLASIAQMFDYQITVCDPREEFMNEWRLPGVTLTRAMPDDAVLALKVDARTAILALTHDPKLDDMALLEALKSDACYVGALGSRVNGAKKRARLQLFDLSEQQVARLHCPVGLQLGARTPEEIALAIMAELTQLRNGLPVSPRDVIPL